MGHPVNGYHFIRHVVQGWKHVQRVLPSFLEKNTTSLELGKIPLLSRTN